MSTGLRCMDTVKTAGESGPDRLTLHQVSGLRSVADTDLLERIPILTEQTYQLGDLVW